MYPQWSYLDGIDSYAPFYSQYILEENPANTTMGLEDVALQIDLLYDRCYDNATGLLTHGYDYSKTASWADPETGASPLVWGRALGWYINGLLETLQIVPQNETIWPGIYEKYVNLNANLLKQADPVSGGWYQIFGRNNDTGNYIESSASAMFAYSFLKGSRLGLLGNETEEYVAAGQKAYSYIVDNFIVDYNNGTISYNGTVGVCSLNSTASYEVNLRCTAGSRARLTALCLPYSTTQRDLSNLIVRLEQMHSLWLHWRSSGSHNGCLGVGNYTTGGIIWDADRRGIQHTPARAV